MSALCSNALPKPAKAPQSACTPKPSGISPRQLSRASVLECGVFTPLSRTSRRSLTITPANRFLLILLSTLSTFAAIADLQLPPHPTNALSTVDLVQRLTPLDLPAREREIIHQFAIGNVPQFWRHFNSIKIKDTETTNTLEYFVAPDYLAIGSDTDYFLTPVSPATASAIADRIDCILPTPKMVDDIYAAAMVKMVPSPIPPSPAMTTVPIFAQHNETVRNARRQFTNALGALTAGHKKDIVLTTRLTNNPTKVAIYGWHKPSGDSQLTNSLTHSLTNSLPIQPLYLGHTAAWVDYSHGARFVRRQMLLNGKPTTAEAILADPALCHLLSNEGPVLQPRYSTTNEFNEIITSFSIHPHIRVVINSPLLEANKPTRLILYALPNGNTIEQTAGRRIQTNEDWHFDIQHIAAQTRFIRTQDTNANYIVAFLEAAEHAWPAWRRAFDTNGTLIPQIVQTLRARFANVPQPLAITLTGHSGGGSFTFGYLNGISEIPGDIERIAFLDGNYAYETPHAAKLGHWLKSSDRHFLIVLAYHDDIALLNGKTFVSANGGTWGRSHAMLNDLKQYFDFIAKVGPAVPSGPPSNPDGNLEIDSALSGRIQFLLKENPNKEILHTRQVELNGFIHAMFAGTARESAGYTYLGPRAYEIFVSE